MEIKTIIQSRLSGPCPTTYRDVANFSDLKDVDMHHVCAYAFCDGKLVLVFDKDKKRWTPPGGHLEGDESLEEGTSREIKEETNMRVVYHQMIGHQAITEPHRVTNQTRSFCIVEPYGPFLADPDGDITEIKLIEPKDAKQYFDWGVVGEHVLKRAVEMLEAYNRGER
ncbi:MAG: NUDIX hydrolase [Candidatus Paceibacterota bacterium]|jgi:ADP-ribose pyrophosphatase YjhB (NUDIX family)